MTLVRTVTPMPDESLPGLVARAAGANVYPYAHDVLVQLGRRRFRPETIAVQPLDLADDLARVLGSDGSRLKPLFHPEAGDGCVDFFGTPLRAVYRETQRRRVSPRALESSGYVRAIWSVRPLSFDPVTRETLIDSCPVCGVVLGFTQTWGIEFCEHCVGLDEWGLPRSSTNLRDFPQALVETGDDEALNYLVALIDPAGSELRHRHKLHPDFEPFSRGDLFQLALSFGAALASIGDDERGYLPAKKEVREPVDPGLLARCGRVLMNWPRSLAPLCEEARRNAPSREGDWGKYKEFGALAALPNDEFLRPEMRRVVQEALYKAFGDFSPTGDLPLVLKGRGLGEYVTSTKLREVTSLTTRVCARLAEHPGVMSIQSTGSSLNSVAFPVWQIEPIARHLLDLVKEVNVCTTLGLPPDAVRDLAGVDFIHAKEDGYAEIAIDVAGEPGRYYSIASVDRMVDLVSRGLKFVRAPEGYTTLWDAMLMFPAGRRPWLPVLMRVLFEQVPAVLHANVADRPKVTNLFTSISVQGLETMRADILADHASAPMYDIGNVSAVHTSLMLGFKSHYVFVDCVDAELLAQNADKSVTYASVLDFSRRFIFANEAAARSGSGYPEVVDWLAGHGVQPKYRFRNGGTLYDREKVEPLLRMTAM